MDNTSGSRDGKDGGEKRRKLGAKLGPNKKPWEAKRGQGIANLEAMRIRGDMEKMLPGNHLGQQPPSAARGTYGLGANVITTSPLLPPYQQQSNASHPPVFLRRNLPSFVGSIVSSNGLPCYQPPAYGRSTMPCQLHTNSVQMAYGTGGRGANGYYNLPYISPLGTSEATSNNANPSNVVPPTLSLFKETSDHDQEGESAYGEREESHYPAVGEPSSSKDSNVPCDELDLDLKL